MKFFLWFIVLFSSITIGIFGKQHRLEEIRSPSPIYNGHLKENERLVQVEPRLTLDDIICGYQLSRYKHDDQINSTDDQIPFELVSEGTEVFLQLKSNIDQLDCETKATYQFYLRAFDCSSELSSRRYSERSALVVSVDDRNEFVPVFTHPRYLFKVYQDQACSSCRIEATDDDCSNLNARVCDYRIVTENVPFTIDVNGSISISKPLTTDQYDFDVVAIDCQLSDDQQEKISQPAHVTVKRIQSCKPTLTDHHPTKLTIQSDHTHVFDTVHLDACDDTCVLDEIVGTVELNNEGLDSGCRTDQCAPSYREHVLIEKDAQVTQASIIPSTIFSGHFQSDFIIRMSMKHNNETDDEKENIFCQTDEKSRNRHHVALFLHDDRLKLLIRKGPIASMEKTLYPSEWTWKLPQIQDDQWHFYKIFVNYPTQIDLYVDDQLITPTDVNFEIVQDHALSIIEETGDKVLSVGACWHARASQMVQSFHGQLSGLIIEQKENISCVRECKEFLEMADIREDLPVDYSSNKDRSQWTFRSDSAELFEQLLKHLVYRNTFDPLGPSGQRTLTLQTGVKCFGENSTYNVPIFTRRLSIDEPIDSIHVELKGDSSFLVKEDDLNHGIDLFRNLSIYAESVKKNSADITYCSIATSPKLSKVEQLIVPEENLDINNLEKVLTQTGLILSGLGSIDSYQSIIRQIRYVARSPIKYFDRTFSLACIGANNQMSTNEIHVQIRVEKPVVAPIPAAVLSSKFIVDNDAIRENIFDLDGYSQGTGNLSGWPIAVVVCVSVALAGVLVLYLIVRINSSHRKRSLLAVHGDDPHPQMEWEDDLGLNIIINPLDDGKKSIPPPLKLSEIDETLHDYDGTTSDDEEYDGHHDDEYSSGEEQDEDEDDEDEDEDEDDVNHIRSRERDHQLEWDDAAIEYAPKKV